MKVKGLFQQNVTIDSISSFATFDYLKDDFSIGETTKNFTPNGHWNEILK